MLPPLQNIDCRKKIVKQKKRLRLFYFLCQGTITRLKAKKDKAFRKSNNSAIESKKANLRVKNAFFNTVHSTMQNHEISAKKKFSFLTKLMKVRNYPRYHQSFRIMRLSTMLSEKATFLTIYSLQKLQYKVMTIPLNLTNCCQL